MLECIKAVIWERCFASDNPLSEITCVEWHIAFTQPPPTKSCLHPDYVLD